MIRKNFRRPPLQEPNSCGCRTTGFLQPLCEFMAGYPLWIFCFLAIPLMISCSGKRHSHKKIFHYNQPEGISTLDPAFAKNQAIMWAVHQIYNTLVEVDRNLKIVPSLARRWEISPDRMTYRFYLRNDVYFHDDGAFINGRGRLMTAHDVVYSFTRIVERSIASPGAWIFNGRVDSINGFKAINDTIFELRLTRPFNPILGILSMQYCSIVPHEVVKKYGNEFARHPCGTGPFRFTVWEEGQTLILGRNNLYFEKDSNGIRLPYLDGISISFLDSKATEFLEFTQGRLDFINDIDASFKDEVLNKRGELKKEWQDKIVLYKRTFLNTEYLGILTDSSNPLVRNSPLKIKSVRQAINYGFDRRKMILYLRNSLGTPAESGFVPPGLPSFDSTLVTGYKYDLDKARRLLAAVGFPDGKNLPPIKLLTIAQYSELGSFIAKQLEELGMKVQVEVVQKSLLLEQTAKSEALFFRGSWMADYPDAENYLSVFYGKNPAPPNYTRYKNPAFDRLYELALMERNDSTRFGIYRQLDQMVMNDAPVVPLWYDMVVRLVNPRVKGFGFNSLNMLELRKVKMQP